MVIRTKDERVVDVNLDVAQTRINLERDKYLRRRASRRVAAKRLYQRDPAVGVCALEQWVGVTLLLVLWLHRVCSKRSKMTRMKVCVAVEVCAPVQSTCGGEAGVREGSGPPSLREKTVRFVSHLSEVIRQRLIMSGDVELNPGPLDDVEQTLLNVDDSTFVEDDWNTVIKECSSLAAHWEHLSGYLGLPISRIAVIKGISPVTAVGCLNEALKEWIQQNYNTGKYGLPSWRTLLEGVARVNMSLFKKLATEHPVASACASSGASTRMETSREHTQVTYVYPATSASGDDQPHPSFPCLNLRGMTKEQKQHLHQRLYAESMDMMDKFQVLLSATTKSLKEREVPVDDLLCHLVGVGAAPPAYRDLNLPVFRQKFPELMDSKKIEKAMFVIGDYILVRHCFGGFYAIWKTEGSM